MIGFDGNARNSAPVGELEKQLIAQRELQDYLESASDWVWQADAEHRFTHFSENFEDLTGFSPAGLIGRSRLEMLAESGVHEDEIRRHAAVLAARHRFRHFIYPLDVPDASTQWFSVSGKPVFSQTGDFLGYRGTATRITDEIVARRRAEQAEHELTELNRTLEVRIETRTRELADSNALLGAVLNAMDQGVVSFDHDKDGRKVVSLINANAIRLLDLPDNALQDQGLPARIEARIKSGLCDDATPDREVYEFEDAAGRIVSAARRQKENGGCIVTLTDVTERRRREREIHDYTRRMEDFASIASDWMWETDEDLRFTFLSPRAEEVTGVPLDYFLGKTREELLAGDGLPEDISGPFADDPEWRRHLDKMRNHRPFRDFAYWRPRPGMAPQFIAISGKPVFDDAGDFTGYRGVGRDQTELKTTELELEAAKEAAEAAAERAEEADRLKSEFLANMSHEIRTPMNGVLGMAELLSKTELDGRQEEMLGIIKTSGAALLTVINDVLDLSKISVGWLEILEEPFSIAKVVTDVTSLLVVQAAAKNLQLNVEIAEDLPDCLIGDEGRMRQVITNLVSNAIKFTELGEVNLCIRGSPLGRRYRLQIEVEDTGIGMSRDAQATIFEPFKQLDGPYTRRHEGTGLGLSISQHLARLMDGVITVDSEEGIGSTFVFSATLSFCDNSSTV